MSDVLPSGMWRGFYEQHGRHFEQELVLEFADGIVRGDGSDGLGSFAVDGEYRVEDGEVRIGWIKTYDGAHSVLYLGVLAEGRVRGEWRIGFTRGGFELRANVMETS
jgi:hypothetical protein